MKIFNKFLLTLLIVSGLWTAVDEVVFNGNSVEQVQVNQGFEDEDSVSDKIIIESSAFSSSNCTALGYNAFSSLKTASNNVMIGYSTGESGIFTNVAPEQEGFWKYYEAVRRELGAFPFRSN